MFRNANTSKARVHQVRPRWTKAEVSALKRLYRSHSNSDIAKVLGRKVSSVVFKGHRLGLSKGVRRLREMGQENIRMRWEPMKRRSVRRRRILHRQ
jgi:hypothetical protein